MDIDPGAGNASEEVVVGIRWIVYSEYQNDETVAI